MRHWPAFVVGVLFSIKAHPDDNFLRDLYISNFQSFENTLHYEVTAFSEVRTDRIYSFIMVEARLKEVFKGSASSEFCFYEQHEIPIRILPVVGETAIGSFPGRSEGTECFFADNATQLGDEPKFLNLVRALRDASASSSPDQSSPFE